MNRKKRLLLITLLAVLVIVPLQLFLREARQEQRDKAFTTAIIQGDTQGALALLNAGADANARDTGDKTLTTGELVTHFWQRLFHHSSHYKAKPTPALLLLVSNYFLFPSSYSPSGANTRNIVFISSHETEENVDLLPLLTALIDHGVDVNVRDPEGNTALKNVVDLAYHKGVRLLLEHGANPNIVNNEGQTPLFAADMESAKLLLEHGADPNIADNRGETPLYQADLEIAKLLVAHGAKVDFHDKWNRTVLLELCSHSYSGGEDPTPNGHTLWGDFARFLIQKGANPNAKDKNGNTPLLTAIGEDRHPDLISALLENGADPNEEAILSPATGDPEANSKDKLHTTPLICAVSNGDTPTVRLLLKHGANVNIRDSEGDTPLRSAAESSEGRSAIPLLKHYGAKE